jgi:tetratricopeptide (TPR) repeat protein
MVRSVGALLLLASATGSAEEGTNPFLTEAKAMYRQLDYEACLNKLKRAAKTASTATDQAGIALYEGLCDFYLGRPSAAQAAFERALQLDPQIHLPAFTSPKIETFFAQIAAAAPAPPAVNTEPTVPPPEPTVRPPAADTPLGAAAREAPPSRGPEAGPTSSEVRLSPEPTTGGHWVFPVVGGAAVLGVGAGIAFGIEAKHWEGTANSATFESDGYRYDRAAKNSAAAANACYGVAAALAVSAGVAWWLQR